MKDQPPGWPIMDEPRITLASTMRRAMAVSIASVLVQNLTIVSRLFNKSAIADLTRGSTIGHNAGYAVNTPGPSGAPNAAAAELLH